MEIQYTNYRKYFKYIIITIFIIIISIFKLQATEQYSSYEGMLFEVSFMQNEFYVVNDAIGVELKIFVSTRQKTNIKVTYPGGTIENYFLPGDSVLVLNISNKYYFTESEVVQNGAIQIETDNPVVVYAFDSQVHTSDSYVCIPVSNWGTQYAIMSVPNDQYDPTSPPPTRSDSLIQYFPRQSEFLLISGYDDTHVTFKPRSLTEKAKQVDKYYTVTLNKGDTYLVKSYTYPKGMGDLTGTLITSDKPVGVLSGHVRTALPQTLPPGKDSKDHLAEMLSPINSWGRTYISVPFGVNPFGDMFRVVNIEPNTKLQVFTSAIPTEYDFTDSLEVKTFYTMNTPAIWQADKPIEIAQFMQRTGSDLESKNFDPSMVMVPPKEQFIQRVLFTTPGGVFYNPEQYSAHYIAVIAEDSAIGNIYLDGRLLDTISNIKTQKIINTDLHWDVIKLDRGTHELIASQGKFSGILFGVGEFDSYAMVLGASLLKPDLVDNMSPLINVKINCFDLNGIAYDFPSSDASGINFGQVDDNQTTNFAYSIYPSQPNDTTIHFWATVKDIYKAGKFVITFWDKQGNKSSYSYDYSPINLDWTRTLDFGTVSWLDSLCLDFYMQNNGNNPIKLDSVILPTDSRLTIYGFDSNIDTLYPNQSISGKLCFNPKGTLQQLNDQISFYFDCGIQKTIPILANLIAPALNVKGWDFGNVYLQDSAEHTISIQNVGNVSVRLDSLSFLVPNSHFEFNTDSLFPKWLSPDSTLDVSVKFKPDQRQNEYCTVQFSNTLNINTQTIVSGTGVAPLFSDYTLNFGERRIGTSNDSTIYIKNIGNIKSLLKFKQFLLQDSNDQNTQTISAIDNIVNADDSLKLSFNYSPNDTVSYHIASLLNCDWLPHPDIMFEIKGFGTLPVIETKNYDFDTVIVFTTNNVSTNLIFSKGNENLTIDSVYVISGDTNSFKINYANLKSLVIPFYQSLTIPISFTPQNIGFNKLVLGVVNDAMPNYLRKTDTIEITGYAIAPENLKASVELYGDGDYSTCLRDTLYASFVNDENFEISLTDIQMIKTPNNIDASFISDIVNSLPIVINANSKITIPVSILLHYGETASIQVIGTFNNKLKQTATLNIQPKTYKISIADIGNITTMPSDTVQMTFSGKVENATDVPIKFDLSLAIDESIFYLLDKSAILEITSNDKTYQIHCSIKQTLDTLTITWKDLPILLNKNDNWKISLKFLTLLSNKNQTDINISLITNDCYNNTTNTLKAILQEVCMNPMRQIIIADDQPTFKIYPNPTNNLLKIDVDLKKNSYITISIFDLFGKELKLENKILSKGKYLLFYVVENMTSGKYFLRIVVNQKIEYNNVINIIR